MIGGHGAWYFSWALTFLHFAPPVFQQPFVRCCESILITFEHVSPVPVGIRQRSFFFILALFGNPSFKILFFANNQIDAIGSVQADAYEDGDLRGGRLSAVKRIFRSASQSCVGMGKEIQSKIRQC
jgi:hypothetical protein